jgi:hypothetical protein
LWYVFIREDPIPSEFSGVIPIDEVPPVVNELYRLVFMVMVIVGMI